MDSKSRDNYEALRDKGLLALQTYMDSLDDGRATKLAFWVNDYAKFLSREAKFDPRRLIRYKRGTIVKVHLGYRIGSEEGGLHYGVIVDVKNDLSSPTATIIPFTSLKPGKDIGKLHRSQVYIGNEIYELLCKKINKEIDETNAMRNRIKDAIKDATTSASAATDSLQNSSVDISDLGAQIKKWNEKLSICEKMHRQIQGMKTGSIALVGQITTVSKIRIYDPIYPSDTLSNIRLSNETMDKLDKKVKELFTNPNLKEKNV